MHGDRAPGADDAEDVVAGNGVAALAVGEGKPRGEPEDGARVLSLAPLALLACRRAPAAAAEGQDLGRGAALAAPELGPQGLEQEAGIEPPLADRREEVLEAAEVEVPPRLLELSLTERDALRAREPLEQFAAAGDEGIALAHAQMAPDPRPRLAGDHEALPLR